MDTADVPGRHVDRDPNILFAATNFCARCDAYSCLADAQLPFKEPERTSQQSEAI